MPCNSDHLKPNERERERKEAAELAVHVCQTLKIDYPYWIFEASQNIYGEGTDEHGKAQDSVKFLCELLSDLNNSDLDAIVYGDIRNPTCRKLASWWERHQKYDLSREAREFDIRKEIHLAIYRANGMANLGLVVKYVSWPKERPPEQKEPAIKAALANMVAEGVLELWYCSTLTLKEFDKLKES